MHVVAQVAYEDPRFMYHVAGPQSEMQGEVKYIEEVKEQCQTIEKRLIFLVGNGVLGAAIVDMCLVLDLLMPAKFKTLEFEKDKGHTCLKSHLVMYYRKMATYTNNYKFIIHRF